MIKRFFLDKNIYPILLSAIFMASSPGVEKNEYSEEYVKEKNIWGKTGKKIIIKSARKSSEK